jgi:uncharacterized membrane protein HdeD (DUF308 family)
MILARSDQTGHNRNVSSESPAPPPVTPRTSQGRVPTIRWGWTLGTGILSFLLGLLIFRSLSLGFGSLRTITAFWIAMAGVTDLVTRHWQYPTALGQVGGIATIIGAVAILLADGPSSMAVPFGIVLVVSGALRAVGVSRMRAVVRQSILSAGVIEVLFGVVALIWPDPTTQVLSIQLAILAVLAGISQIILAAQIRNRTRG